ncbi:MAG: cell division protein ZapA [Bacteroidales bacterium]|nr:cell division protein ZapA [Bacteroidales bacterium]
MPAQTKHSITLKIAGKEYSLVATQESEHYMRMAADKINAMLADYDTRYPDQTLADKLVFVALTNTISMLVAKKGLAQNTDETAKLEKELKAYLNKIETNR